MALALIILRSARGMSQRELSRRTPNITQTMISGYENGHRAPKLPSLRALLKTLDFTLAELDAVMAFVRALRGEPAGPTEDRDRRRAEVVGAALRLAAGLVALAGTAGTERPK